jgi:hypothetical protein
MGVTVIVAFPSMAVKAGIATTPVWSARPIIPPPVISKTTPGGVPASGIGEVNSSLQ